MLPVNSTTTHPLLQWVELEAKEIVLDDYIRFNIHYFNASSVKIDIREYTITDEEYSAWGDNDDYIPDILFSRLGLTTRVV